MAKAKIKTVENTQSVAKFLNAIEPPQKRKDAKHLLKLMQDISGTKPKMWGDSIVGFGKYHYKYESGREGEMPKIGFSPRKNALTLYIMPGFDRFDDELKRLGKYKTGKSCLYIKKLEDVDMDVLREMARKEWIYMSEKYDPA